MSEECTHDCSSCGSACDHREEKQPDFRAPENKASHVKHVIGVVSGKGGVGKSLVSSMLTVALSREGMSTAILDADITGPSIPRAFGLKGNAAAGEDGIIPVRTRTGVQVMSLNLLMPDVTEPVVWRGPVIAGAVKQFWSDVCWGDVDYMVVDMPPGTGDVPLTVFQSLPVDGVIVVASPQELVGMIVEKAIKMAEMLKVPVLGLVENMSSFKCPDCGGVHKIFGESHIDRIARTYGVDTVVSLPIDPALAAACDAGRIESADTEAFAKLVDKLLDTVGT